MESDNLLLNLKYSCLITELYSFLDDEQIRTIISNADNQAMEDYKKELIYQDAKKGESEK